MLDMCISALVATCVVCWRAEECPSVCPSVRRGLYTALYSSGESTDDIYSVYVIRRLAATVQGRVESSTN